MTETVVTDVFLNTTSKKIFIKKQKNGVHKDLAELVDPSILESRFGACMRGWGCCERDCCCACCGSCATAPAALRGSAEWSLHRFGGLLSFALQCLHVLTRCVEELLTKGITYGDGRDTGTRKRSVEGEGDKLVLDLRVGPADDQQTASTFLSREHGFEP